MHGDEALKLLRECKRSQEKLAPYSELLVSTVLTETKLLQEEMDDMIAKTRESAKYRTPQLKTKARMHQLALRRDKRCLLAYHKHRMDKIKNLYWELGKLPKDTAKICCPSELAFYEDYRNLVNSYNETFLDVDLMASLHPPKDLYMYVRVLQDCGEIETESGPIQLKKDSQLYLKRVDAERLIIQGYLQHVQE